jgi:CheY-like chemotaxis protein
MTKYAKPNLVLYADDDADDLDLVREAFAQYSNNVDVVSFMDGTTVLSYLQSLSPLDPQPCLIILDINMPVMNGKEALIKIREMQPFEALPVVLFTTSSQPQDHSFAARYKAGFVTKPLDVKQMEFITEQFIDHCTEEIRNKIRRQIQ